MSGLLNKIFKSDDKKVDDKETTVVLDKQEEAVNEVEEIKKEEVKTAKTTVKKEVAKKNKVEKRIDLDVYKVIEKPLITEKATDLAQFNKYIFVVPVSANKSEVAKKIESLYGVKPIAVNMIKQKGRKVRHGRVSGRTKSYKKAIITLAPGEKIEVYEGV